MIPKLIDLCARNRLLVLLLTGFVVLAGLRAVTNIRLDAIPDLSDVQVIIVTDWPEQSPEVIEDQITYPLTTAMTAVPHARTVRGQSMFGVSFVYVVFEDGTDLYWARSRVLEYLNYVSGRLPAGVTPRIGPDATGVGWVYEYSLRNGWHCPQHPDGMYHDPEAAGDPVTWYASREDAPAPIRERLERVRMFDEPGTCPFDGRTPRVHAEYDLSELRGLQDWYLRYELTSVDGVSEVASVGGFVRQYQVIIDPDRLLAYDMALKDVREAVERSNLDVGGSVIEMSETEYMIRSRGYLGRLTPEQMRRARETGVPLQRARARQVIEDLRRIVLRANPQGTPVYLRDVCDVVIGPELRRGVAESDGKGEVAGGIVVMRHGGNARQVIRDVKEKLDELRTGLPPGVDVVTEYDRSGLIERAVDTLTVALLQEMLVVGLVCIILLLHMRSELVAMFVVPTGVLISLIVMDRLGINANIMSLGGIAIAIGVMVDSAVVMVENAHKHLDREEERLHRAAFAGESVEPRPRAEVIIDAAKEVGPTLFFSLLIITVSFLPVFALGEESGRLFKPLAYTKTFAVAAGSLLAVTVIPVLMVLFITPRVLPKRWGWGKNTLLTLTAMAVPAGLIYAAPVSFGAWDPYRTWIAGGWVVICGMLLLPQKIIHEQANPISRLMQRVYDPFFRLSIAAPWLTIALAALITLSTFVPLIGLRKVPLIGDRVADRWPELDKTFPGMGREFMPPLEEGDLLYMPTTDPGVSITKARELLQQTDKLIATFPEVKRVFGKIGRADTATDPAPMSMIETTIMLEPDRAKWRQRRLERWHAFLPEGVRRWTGLEYFWPSTRPINEDELVNGYEEAGERHFGLNEVVSFPGLTNSWTQPIRTRIDMLSTGIKTPVGIKITGDDLEVLADLGDRVLAEVLALPGTRNAFTEKTLGGKYLDVTIHRDEIARYGLTVADVHEVVLTAIGGMNVTWTVEGLERYPVNLRYKRELRDNLPDLRRTLVAAPSGAQIPLAQLADIRVNPGPDMIRSENSRKAVWIYVDPSTTDIVGWIDAARERLAETVELPTGYSLSWSGQYEYIQAANARLKVVVPLTAVIIVLLLYINMRSWFQTCVVLLAVPFSLVGAVWFVYLLDYNLSLAVVIGMIALAGVDAETGQVMLLYLHASHDRFKEEGRLNTRRDLLTAIHDGAVMRIRPKMMTVATDFIGLLPLMWAVGAGADTMRRMAAPLIGGMFTSFILELLVYPSIFYLARRGALPAGK
ncbi:MAG: Cation efflux system protein CusA [Phycisphaerae bacterium]|nr:Cation efflux system protein CusA [Phycisphaerae bacterium]